ncbi:MAG: hypothetical protein KAH95_08205 [Spirochaetales bacterium]|nr:hypothetical protein [Spirochaetales bacterium]
MKKLTGILLLLFISIFNISAAENIIDFLSPAEKGLLYSDGEISRYFFDEELPSYIFPTDYKSDLLEKISKLDVTIGVESLFLLKYSDLIIKDNTSMLSVYNTLLSVKTMKGIEYYSQSRKKMRTLYTESFAVKDMDSTDPIDDPVYKTIPAILNRYLLQTDKTFGKNLYKAVYKYDGSTIWINIVNETKMKYSFIPMVNKGNMSVSLFVTAIDDGLLFYGVSTAETSTFLGLAKSKKESFYNRIKAMFTWFEDQLEAR